MRIVCAFERAVLARWLVPLDGNSPVRPIQESDTGNIASMGRRSADRGSGDEAYKETEMKIRFILVMVVAVASVMAQHRGATPASNPPRARAREQHAARKK